MEKEWVRVSDPEKTLIDLIYFNYPFLDEILPELKRIVDRRKLRKYLKRIENIRGSKKIRRKLNKLVVLR